VVFIPIDLVCCGPAAGEMEAVGRQERDRSVAKRLLAAQLKLDAMALLEHVRHRKYADRIFVYLSGNNRNRSRVGVVGKPRFRLLFVELTVRGLEPACTHLGSVSVRIDIVELHDEVRITRVD